MKVNLKKIGAIVAGATILASSVAFAGLWFGSTELVNGNGAPVAKVVVGEHAAASDGVAAANIAAKLASDAFKTSTLTAQVAGEATCAVGSGAATGGSCTISNEKVKLEVTVPGLTAAGTYTLKELVSGIIDRTLEDRGQATLVNYSLATAETSDEAHPFTKGDGATTTVGGQSQQGLFKIGGNLYDGLATMNIEDKDAGKTYKEVQTAFVRGETSYRDADDTVDGKIRNFIYQVKFTQDNYGIPRCTVSTNSSWTECSEGSTDATSSHRVKLKFLGSQWIITKMEGPGTTVHNETTVVNGGTLTLSKESVGGIVNVGESLAAGAYTVRLDDIKSGNTASEQGAIVSLLDASGSVLKQSVIAPGNTVTLTTTPTGEKILVRVFKTAPGYTFGAKWADMAIISNELVLKDADSPEINGDKESNTNWKVVLGWKNRDVSSSTGAINTTDHLRTVVLYRDGVTDFLKKGDGLNVIEKPSQWKFLFKGLDLDKSKSDDYDTFTMTVNDGTFTYTADGTTSSVEANHVKNYLKITSTVSGAFSAASGTGKEMIVLFGDGTNRSADLNISTNAGFGAGVQLSPSSILLRMANGKYINVGNATTSNGSNSPAASRNVSYTVAGAAGAMSTGGALMFAYNQGPSNAVTSYCPNALDMTVGTGKSNYSIASQTGVANNCLNDTFSVILSEDAGEGLASQKPSFLGFNYNLTGKTLNVDNGQFAKDKVRYASVANASALSYSSAGAGVDDSSFTTSVRTSMPENREVNYITERGSIVTDQSTSSVTVKVAKRPARAQFFLTPSETSTVEPTKRQYTLSEGQEVELEGTGGIKVKALDISEDVGACNVGTGPAPACTVDRTGLSAVIMPDNKASVVAGVPYGYDKFGPLVVLDKDASETDVLVTVGGPAVNKVTKDALSGSAVDFKTEKKVVKEVAAGKRVVVAGLTADDTLEAAKDFISQLRRQ